MRSQAAAGWIAGAALVALAVLPMVPAAAQDGPLPAPPESPRLDGEPGESRPIENMGAGDLGPPPREEPDAARERRNALHEDLIEERDRAEVRRKQRRIGHAGDQRDLDRLERTTRARDSSRDLSLDVDRRAAGARSDANRAGRLQRDVQRESRDQRTRLDQRSAKREVERRQRREPGGASRR